MSTNSANNQLSLSIQNPETFLLEYAEIIGVRMSKNQATVLASALPKKRKALERAVLSIAAHTLNGRLENAPTRFWKSEDGLTTGSILVIYSLAGCDPISRQIALLASYYQTPVTAEIMGPYLDGISLGKIEDQLEVMMNLNLLVREDGKYALTLPTKTWAEELEKTTKTTTPLALGHAHTFINAHNFRSLDLLYYSIPNPDLLEDIGRLDELFAAILRVMDSPLICAKLALHYFVSALSQSDASRFQDISKIMFSLTETLVNEFTTHLFACLAEIVFLADGDATQACALLDKAQTNWQKFRGETSPNIELRRIFYVNIAQTECAENLRRSENVLRRVEMESPDSNLHVLACRYYGRALIQAGFQEKAMIESWRALEIAARNNSGLGVICKMELVDNLRNEISKETPLIRLCNEALQELNEDFFPRHATLVHFFLGYHYFFIDQLPDALVHLKKADIGFLNSGDEYQAMTTTQVLALIAIRQKRQKDALTLQQKIGWPFDVTSVDSRMPRVIYFSIGIIVYALCGERHSAARMKLEYLAYLEGCEEPETYAIITDYIEIHLELIHANENRTDPNSKRTLQRVLKFLPAVRNRMQQLIDYSRMPKGMDRTIDIWLEERGLQLFNGPELIVDQIDLTWFSLGGERVSVVRRYVMRRLLSGLIVHQQASNPSPILLENLFEIGWPGESVSYESMQARVYNTISRMRRLGLGDVIIHDGVGYSLDPKCVVKFSDSVDGA